MQKSPMYNEGNGPKASHFLSADLWPKSAVPVQHNDTLFLLLLLDDDDDAKSKLGMWRLVQREIMRKPDGIFNNYMAIEVSHHLFPTRLH